MKPTKLITTLDPKCFMLVFEAVDFEDSFEDIKFEKESRYAIVHCNSVKKEVEYMSSEDFQNFISCFNASQNKVMDFHFDFEIKDMPEMKKLYLLSWQHMYYCIIFTGFDWPHFMSLRARANRKESRESVAEFVQEFLQDEYGNRGIKVI